MLRQKPDLRPYMPRWAKLFWIVVAVSLLAIILACLVMDWGIAQMIAMAGTWSIAFAIGRLILRISAARNRYLVLRSPTGFCVGCGYDLRATSDRCPECGTPVPAGHVARAGGRTMR